MRGGWPDIEALSRRRRADLPSTKARGRVILALALGLLLLTACCGISSGGGAHRGQAARRMGRDARELHGAARPERFIGTVRALLEALPSGTLSG